MTAQRLGLPSTGRVKSSNGAGYDAETGIVPAGCETCAQHPDAALLALCVSLTAMQAEWQRLYDATSDSVPLTTAADFAWKAYSDDVWPGIRVSTWGDRPVHPDDVPGRLRELRAATPEGRTAKARAILALDEAASYCDLRDDSIDLMHSLLRDVAGLEAHGLGADAPPVGS